MLVVSILPAQRESCSVHDREAGPERAQQRYAVLLVLLFAALAVLLMAMAGCGGTADPFVGSWQGVDNPSDPLDNGFSSLTMEIRQLDGGNYELVKDDGTRIPLYQANGTLTGSDYLELKKGTILKAEVVFHSSAENRLHETMKVKTSSDLGDITTAIDWTRSDPDTTAAAAPSPVTPSATPDPGAPVKRYMRKVARLLSPILQERAWRRGHSKPQGAQVIGQHVMTHLVGSYVKWWGKPETTARNYEDVALKLSRIKVPSPLKSGNRKLVRVMRIEAGRWYAFERFSVQGYSQSSAFWDKYTSWRSWSDGQLRTQQKLLNDWYFDLRLATTDSGAGPIPKTIRRFAFPAQVIQN